MDATTESQLITVECRTKSLTHEELFNLIWGINYQVLYHYGRSAWVTQGYAPPAHVVALPQSIKPPVGAWNLILLDHSDQQGALGYHDDQAGNDIPYAEVFCVDAVQDGSTPSAVASHEALEMLVDPNVNDVKTAKNASNDQIYIVEVCDAVQGQDYDVGGPEGRTTGVMVANFCLPSWWEIGDGAPPWDFRSLLAGPFELAPGGYISVAPESNPNDWSQIWGSQQDRLPKWASRLPRIHGLR